MVWLVGAGLKPAPKCVCGGLVGGPRRRGHPLRASLRLLASPYAEAKGTVVVALRVCVGWPRGAALRMLVVWFVGAGLKPAPTRVCGGWLVGGARRRGHPLRSLRSASPYAEAKGTVVVALRVCVGWPRGGGATDVGWLVGAGLKPAPTWVCEGLVGWWSASARAYPCVRFAPRPLSLREMGRWWLRPSCPGIPCERRYACSRPLALKRRGPTVPSARVATVSSRCE